MTRVTELGAPRAGRLVEVWPWALLMAATICAWLLAEDLPDGRVATTAIIIIASLKIRMVIRYFMEVRWSAKPWRYVLEAWLLVVTLMLLAGYWLAEGQVMQGAA